MKKIYYYLGVVVFVLGGYFYIHSNNGESNSLIQTIKYFLPEASIKFLREKIFVYRNQEILQEQWAEKDREMKRRLKKSLNLVDAQSAQLEIQEKILINLSAGLDTIAFYRNKDP